MLLLSCESLLLVVLLILFELSKEWVLVLLLVVLECVAVGLWWVEEVLWLRRLLLLMSSRVGSAFEVIDDVEELGVEVQRILFFSRDEWAFWRLLLDLELLWLKHIMFLLLLVVHSVS